MATDEQWHQFEALRDDGAPARFRIRELAPRTDQPKIFVVELPYPITDLSRLPDATSYRRIATFEENWLIPAAGSLGWTFVAAKIDDGSCFLYLYGASDPTPMIERLAPFDGGLGFFDESDPSWDEYAALKELLDEANALPSAGEEDDDRAPTKVRPSPDDDDQDDDAVDARITTRFPRMQGPTIPAITAPPRPRPPVHAKPATKAKAAPIARAAVKATARSKPAPKPMAKAASKPKAKATSKPAPKAKAQAKRTPPAKAKAKAKAKRTPPAKAKRTPAAKKRR